MNRYSIRAMDADRPDPYYSPPSYLFRDARDVMVVDSNELVGEFTGLYNDKGHRIYREPNQIGFGKD